MFSGPQIYMFKVKRSRNMKSGSYFTLGDSPAGALAQAIYAADDRNRNVVQQFVKRQGYKSVKEMCDSNEGAYKLSDVLKAIKKDTVETIAVITPDEFINSNNFVGSVIRGLLPIEPNEFLKWYDAKIA